MGVHGNVLPGGGARTVFGRAASTARSAACSAASARRSWRVAIDGSAASTSLGSGGSPPRS
jgi:hypothetical protein